jgi:hypothetical protein
MSSSVTEIDPLSDKASRDRQPVTPVSLNEKADSLLFEKFQDFK